MLFVIRTLLKQYHCHQSATIRLSYVWYIAQYSGITNNLPRNASYALALCCARAELDVRGQVYPHVMSCQFQIQGYTGTKTVQKWSFQIGTLVIKKCREVMVLSVAAVILNAHRVLHVFFLLLLLKWSPADNSDQIFISTYIYIKSYIFQLLSVTWCYSVCTVYFMNSEQSFLCFGWLWLYWQSMWFIHQYSSGLLHW